MTAGPVRIIATFRPSASREREVLDVLREVQTASRNETGNQEYEIYGSDVNGTVRFHIIETYADSVAVEAHRASEHYRSYRAQIVDLLDAPIDVAILQDAAELAGGD